MQGPAEYAEMISDAIDRGDPVCAMDVLVEASRSQMIIGEDTYPYIEGINELRAKLAATKAR